MQPHADPPSPRYRPWITAFALLLSAASASAVGLYDPALGTVPSAQGWSVLAIGAPATQGVVLGTSPVYRLDTSGIGVGYWGNAIVSPLPLDTAAGFDLSFALRIDSETHSGDNRAGYSVVVVGADPRQAIELSFWAGHVWVPDYDASDPDRFVHGADVAFDTTAALRSYRLSVRDQQYRLSSGSMLLLSGALHDYTAAGLPYTQPNFVFFGDDSSRGASVSALGNVDLLAAPVPEPASAALLLAGLGALAWRLRQGRRE